MALQSAIRQSCLVAGAWLLLGAATAAPPANGVYVEGDFGWINSGNDQSTLDGDLQAAGASGFSSSLSNAAIGRGILGYRVNNNVAVELSYFGSGNENYTASGGNLLTSINATASVNGESASVVGILPLSPEFSLFGKLGVASTKETANISTAGFSVGASSTKTAATYGFGARWDLQNQVFFTASVDRLGVGSSSSTSWLTTGTVGVGYQF